MQIYKTTNLVNGKFYIGQSKYDDPEYLGSGKLINLAIRKYGKKSFKKEILVECSSVKEMNEMEIFYQNMYSDCFSPKGYNICHGVWGGDNFSNNPNKEVIRKKLSDQKIGNKIWLGRHHKLETIEKLRNMKLGVDHSGKNNPMYQKHHSDQTKKEMSLCRKGIYYLERYGEERSKEIKLKSGKKLKGKNTGLRPYMVGDRNPSKNEDVRKKISLKKKENDKNKIWCSHCGNNFTKPNFIKSHGEKCHETRIRS